MGRGGWLSEVDVKPNNLVSAREWLLWELGSFAVAVIEAVFI